jgi:hypothetical protein
MSIPPNFEFSFQNKRTRLRVEERLVAKANPPCFKGKMRIAIKTILVPKQMRAILRGVQVSWRE